MSPEEREAKLKAEARALALSGTTNEGKNYKRKLPQLPQPQLRFQQQQQPQQPPPPVQQQQQQQYTTVQPQSPFAAVGSSSDAKVIRVSHAQWQRQHQQQQHQFQRSVTTSSSMYEVIFSAKRLGLGLKAEGGQTVVSSTQNPTVTTGDILISVANENVQNRPPGFIRRLLVAQSKRPITVQFQHSGVSVSAAPAALSKPPPPAPSQPRPEESYGGGGVVIMPRRRRRVGSRPFLPNCTICSMEPNGNSRPILCRGVQMDGPFGSVNPTK